MFVGVRSDRLVLGLGGTELTDVELELVALEDVTVGTAGLAGAGGDGGVETPGGELGLEQGVDLGVRLALFEAGEGLLGRLGLLLGFLLEGLLALLGDGDVVVLLVPLTERRGVDLDDGRLDEGVRSDKLVVGGVVDLYEMVSGMGGRKEQERQRRTTSIKRVLRVQCSEAQAKLPESRRRARNLVLPPRVRTVEMRFGLSRRVLAGWRPSSNFLFLR